MKHLRHYLHPLMTASGPEADISKLLSLSQSTPRSTPAISQGALDHSLSRRAAADFLICAVVPAVHRVFEALDIALAVEGDWPEYGLVCTFV